MAAWTKRDGNDMDQYADDLAELITKLDLKNIVMVGPAAARWRTL